MTIYRDDIQETITYTNITLSKTFGSTYESLFLKDDALHRVKVLQEDVINITDELFDSARFPLNDFIWMNDTYTDRIIGRDLIFESISAIDDVIGKLKAQSIIVDQLNSSTDQQDQLRGNCLDFIGINDLFNTKLFSIISLNEKVFIRENLFSKVLYKDFVQENIDIASLIFKQKIKSNINENIYFSEHYNGKNSVKTIIDERLNARDSSVTRYSDQIIEHVISTENYKQKLKVSQIVNDDLSISESINQKLRVKHFLNDILYHNDLVSEKSYAKQFINDIVFIDESEQLTNYGNAWTANVDTWAMSRYQDYGYSELIVIDGVLYGVGADGVYRLDANSFVDAKLTTGQLDLGQGGLVHPLGAYLEYELSGSSKKLEIGVSTTQSGAKQTYTYNLPTEPSNYLTNGRVLFGKGLRGRHFSFEIKIGGLYGYINDLSIDMTTTKRRV